VRTRTLEPLPEQVYVQDTESSVSIRVVRGDRVIEATETIYGDDLASETETKGAIARCAAAIHAML
jgi:hypothetical protein